MKSSEKQDYEHIKQIINDDAYRSLTSNERAWFDPILSKALAFVGDRQLQLPRSVDHFVFIDFVKKNKEALVCSIDAYIRCNTTGFVLDLMDKKVSDMTGLEYACYLDALEYRKQMITHLSGRQIKGEERY